MDDRQIITTQQEQSEAATAAADSGFDVFLKQFTMDTMPACPVGMRLLYDFGLSHPTLYGMAERGDFQTVPSPVSSTTKWKAYALHVHTCADCNESGAQPIPYRG